MEFDLKNGDTARPRERKAFDNSGKELYYVQCTITHWCTKSEPPNGANRRAAGWVRGKRTFANWQLARLYKIWTVLSNRLSVQTTPMPSTPGMGVFCFFVQNRIQEVKTWR